MWHELTPNCAFELPMFSEMSIYFRFGEFRANSRSIYVLFLGKVMPNFCMTLMHARIFIINFFIITDRGKGIPSFDEMVIIVSEK